MILTKNVIYRGREIPVESLHKKSKKLVTVQCPVCNNIRIVPYWYITKNGHDMCKPCAMKSRFEKQLTIGRKYNRLTVIKAGTKSGTSVCECECGTVCTVNNTSLITSETKSCGCLRREAGKKQLELLHKAQKREHHPRWKGGIAPIRNCIEATKEYKKFKRDVINKHNGACALCGSRENIEVHHLYGFAINKEHRTDSDNAVLLCRKCHDKFHNQYGFNVTPEKYQRFASQI